MEEITRILKDIEAGRSLASNELFPLVYAELRRLAAARIQNERPGQTLQPTALVHEVFLRMVAPDCQQKWKSVGHFFAAAAESMRRILIENARRKNRQKRGGGQQRVSLDLEKLGQPLDDECLLSLDEALEQLSELDPVKSRLVVMRYFGGMTVEQACEVLEISRATAHRHWTFARAWLFDRITALDREN